MGFDTGDALLGRPNISAHTFTVSRNGEYFEPCQPRWVRTAAQLRSAPSRWLRSNAEWYGFANYWYPAELFRG